MNRLITVDYAFVFLTKKFRADSIQGFSPFFLLYVQKNLITLIRVYSILIILAPMAFKRPSMSS
jgi:hypothetical protein